jgi:hypothetical protein
MQGFHLVLVTPATFRGPRCRGTGLFFSFLILKGNIIELLLYHEIGVSFFLQIFEAFNRKLKKRQLPEERTDGPVGLVLLK